MFAGAVAVPGWRGVLGILATLAAACARCAAAAADAGAPSSPEVGGTQTFDREPMDQTAVAGTKVTLPCRVTNRKGVLQWTKDDFGLGVVRSLDGYARYRMEGSDDENDFSLIINPVTLEDDATYQCQVSQTPGQPQLRSRLAKVTVLYPPERPEIVQGPLLVTTEGKEVALECEARSGKPAAEVSWIDDGGKIRDAECVTIYQSDGKRANRRCFLKLVVVRAHHNRTFTCLAHNGALAHPLSASVLLQVKFPPSIHKDVLPRRIVEWDTVTFACPAEANPPVLSYKWFRDGDRVPGDSSRAEYVVPRINRTYDKARIACQVTNLVGTSEETFELSVSFPPEFKSVSKNTSEKPGGAIKVSCEVDGNPKPEIVWVRMDTRQVVSFEGTLRIDNLTAEHAGWYSCRASSRGFPEISAQVRVFLQEPPTLSSPTVQHSFIGGQAYVDCVFHSVPDQRPANWTRFGEVLEAGTKYAFESSRSGDHLRSTLVVKNAAWEDAGPYICTAENAHGRREAAVELRLRALVVIASGVASVAVLLLCVVLVTVARRCLGEKGKGTVSCAGSLKHQKKELPSSARKVGGARGSGCANGSSRRGPDRGNGEELDPCLAGDAPFEEGRPFPDVRGPPNGVLDAAGIRGAIAFAPRHRDDGRHLGHAMGILL